MQRDTLALIYIVKERFYNKTTQSYIRREIQRVGYKVEIELTKESLDSEILDTILELSPKSQILICANVEKIPLVGRVLSTLLDVDLELNGNLLTPSNVKKFTQNSYLVEYKGININVLSINETSKIPQILLKPTLKKRYLILLSDKETKKSLKSWIKKSPTARILYLIEDYVEVEVYFKQEIISFEYLLEKLNLKYIQKQSLIEAMIEFFEAKSQKITFAESCTGGALSSRFISYSGASKIIDGSLVTYSNDKKIEWLEVSPQTLEKYGAVSKETVLEMAAGAKKRAKANIAIAISGIAGPTGAVENKPVGTVYICIDLEEEVITKKLNLEGDRVFIQSKSVDWAIYLLLKALGDDFFMFFIKNS